MRSERELRIESVDLMLALRTYGWSEFFLYLEPSSGKETRLWFPVSQATADPYDDLIDALDELLDKGVSSFYFDGEGSELYFDMTIVFPKWRYVSVAIKEARFKLLVDGEEPIIFSEYHFHVGLKCWIKLWYTQLYKNYLMMFNDRGYSAHKRFPEEKFLEFQKRAISFLKLEEH
jgi:hypothetical protein